MGEIRIIRRGLPELLPMRERSEGYHVSRIINYLCIQQGHYADSGPDITPRARSRMELGCALEDSVALRFAQDNPGRFIQPGELELDGIFGTPDLLDVKDDAIEELKLTWMSSKYEPTHVKFWKYWVQVKAYCEMWGTLTGRVTVVHVNGDYSYSDDSGVDAYTMEQKFTMQELARNWKMLTTNAPHAYAA